MKGLEVMSQFSVSFHLKTEDPQICVDMINSCGLKGYVFPQVNNWVSFVCEEEDITKNNSIIQANKGLLIYYYYAEDFGWGFSVFKLKKRICRYECMWSGPMLDEYGEFVFDEDGELLELQDLKVEDADLKMNILFQLLDNDFNKMNYMKELLHPQSIEEAIQNNPSYNFAELLGIENFDWISYEYVSRNSEEFAGIIKV